MKETKRKNVALFMFFLGFLFLAVCMEGLDMNTIGFAGGILLAGIGISLSLFAIEYGNLGTYEEEEDNYGNE